MTYFLAGCILTFSAMSIYCWRRERHHKREWRKALDNSNSLLHDAIRFGYELGRADVDKVLFRDDKEARIQ